MRHKVRALKVLQITIVTSYSNPILYIFRQRSDRKNSAISAFEKAKQHVLHMYCIYCYTAWSFIKSWKHWWFINWFACSMNYVDCNDVWNYKQYGSMDSWS